MDKQNFGESKIFTPFGVKRHQIADEIFDPSTESDSSSSSNPYEIQPFILELHEITKENPSPEHVKKVKKTKKKKRNRSQVSVSSGSTANSVAPAPVEEQPREEFYDAHESYHALPESQISNPVAIAALVQAHSEHGQDPKVLDSKVQENVSSQGQTSEAQKQPSAITKPVTGPE